MHPAVRPIISFFVAWFALVALGAAIGAQFVLYNLAQMAGGVDFGTRVAVTFSDVFGLLPVISVFTGRGLWSMVLGVAFLIAMSGAWACVKWAPPVFAQNKEVVYSVAGFVGCAGFILIFPALVGLAITPIAAARTWFGFIAQGFAGAVAGYIYILVRKQFETAT